MKQLIQLLCIMGALLFVWQCPAQDQQTLDSLENLLHEQSDTGKTKIYYEIAHHLFKYRMDTDTLEYYANKIMSIADQYDDDRSRMRAFYLKGQIAYRQQDYGSAKVYFEKANDLLDTTQVTQWHSKIPNALGVMHSKVDDNEKALEYYQKAQKVAEHLKAYDLLGPTYTNIAIIHGNLLNYDIAFDYMHKALYAARISKNKPSELSTMYSMVAAFMNAERLDSALHYTNSYLEQSIELDYIQGIIRGTKQLSQIYMFQEAFEQSKQYAYTVVELANENNSTIDLLSAYRVLVAVHSKLGETNQALIAIDSVYQILERVPQKIYHVNSYESIAETYSELGRNEEAYELQLKSTLLRDSLYGAEQQDKIRIMQNMYEVEKKERQLVELNQRSDRQAFQLQQRNTLLLGLALISLLLILSIYLYTQQRVLKAQKKVSEVEYRLLRLQMNPHFLFNTLSAIQSFLFDKSNTKQAIRYLSKFSHLMRQVLEYSRENQIYLDDEIKTLENYLSLQQLRYDKGFEYEIEVDPQINPAETLIPPILAQPFVENAIEHGKVHLAENGKIWVRFRKKGDILNLVIEDNGIGRARARENVSLKQHKSLASEITRDRMDILSRFSRRSLDFEIIDLPEKGTKVVFALPILEAI